MKLLKGLRTMTSKAFVFDIKRFAVHDGSGLRTTLFFKGCPLRCKWCQNPEGLHPYRQVIYMTNQCIHCRRCQQFALIGQMRYENNRPYIVKDYQGDFDNIVNACPSGALRYDCQSYDVEELMEAIESDVVFYRDDGGVTFSGGEPLLQGEFLLALVKACHEKGIHMALESSLYGSWSLIKKILPYLDIVYADLKVFDDCLHQKYTGKSNRIIKRNIRLLLESEYKDKVIMRTPLIPNMTATDENIRQIAEFLYDVDKNVKYELLNYNPLAKAKYDLYDETYGVAADAKMFDQQEMNHFYRIVYQSGIQNITIE